MNAGKAMRGRAYRSRGEFSGRLESLEARTLLNGTLAADVGGAAMRQGRDSSADTLTVAIERAGSYNYDDASGGFLGNNALPFVTGVVSSLDARIDVYATSRRGKPILIAQTTPRSDLSWTVDSNIHLADGVYTIQARALDDSAGSSGAVASNPVKLTIDTVAPRVVGVQFQPSRGQVVVTFRDLGGDRNRGTGLNPSTVDFAPTYDILTASSAQWEGESVATPPAQSRGPLRVTVTFNGGAPIPAGNYQFSIRSPGPEPLATYYYPYFVHIPSFVLGVRDLADNPLDGGADSTITAEDANDFATGFTVVDGRGFQTGVRPAAAFWMGSMRS